MVASASVVLVCVLSAVVPVPSVSVPSSYICIEAESGLALDEAEADLPRPPASMVKMMLMFLVAEGLDAGRWTLDTPVEVSARAASIGGSQVYLKQGEVWPLGHMMRAVSVASANDAAVAVAEVLWGSEAAYLEHANRRAQELGMLDTRFNSVHGLPPDPGKEYDRTTARDMATLARWCVREPIVLEWSREQELQFRPEESVRYNTNKLLWRLVGCDGLKTGYTRAAGFCVAVTAYRDGVRLIAVVMGDENMQSRFDRAETMLETAFGELRRTPWLAKGQPVGPAIRVQNSPLERIHVVAVEDVSVTVRERDRDRLRLVIQCPERFRAPLLSGTTVGEGLVQLDGYTLARVPLAVPQDIPSAGWRWKLERTALPRD